MKMHSLASTLAIASAVTFAPALQAIDNATLNWTMWGGDHTRNMVGVATNLPESFDPGKPLADSEEIDPATTKNVRWVAKLGSQTYGNPTIGGGRVYVGTNNQSPRDPNLSGDRSVVMAFDEKTGKFIWHFPIPKLGAGKVSDWEYLGICSSPHYEDERLYLLSNKCEVIAMDAAGMSTGNEGVQDELEYLAAEGQSKVEPANPEILGDLLWRFDMIDECGVFPHNITSSSVLSLGENLFVTTSNGMDWSHVNIPSPMAPALIVLNKEGELVAEEMSGISARLLHANWSSPTLVDVDGQSLVAFGAGDGFCYAFKPEPKDTPDGMALDEVWRFDCNPPEYRTDESGKTRRYISYDGPSEIIATPVAYKGRVYVAIGQDPEHGEGIGNLVCIDAKGSGDITKTNEVWSYRDIGRSISTVSIQDGLLYAGEYNGKLHCLDAETGKPYWVYDTGSVIWGSPLVADGKVYIGNESGELHILRAGKEEKLLSKTEMGSPIYASPVVANNVLYVATQTHLYALENQSTESGKACEAK